MTGNMISDFVKGKKKFDYPPNIQKGIMLHRMIDEWTDEHPATKKAKEFFRPAYRLYSGAFIDVVYDHFLALDENEFPGTSLLSFSKEVYSVLEQVKEILPPPFSKMLPYMKEQNWLYHYREKEGINKSFRGLARRAIYLTESDTAFALFNENYKELGQCYREFFPGLKSFSLQMHEELLKLPG